MVFVAASGCLAKHLPLSSGQKFQKTTERPCGLSVIASTPFVYIPQNQLIKVAFSILIKPFLNLFLLVSPFMEFKSTKVWSVHKNPLD